MATLYFVDGYHGGIRGHMPEGSWQDILHALERFPEWKISLEIEPDSWEYLRQHDLRTYRRLQVFISDPNTADRIEFISGSYAQPFCWAVNGESNIRQLLYGRKIVKHHFPNVVIDTYAVQEPCFTSALPQILKLLGYQRMSLKNPTAWGGYMAKMPGEIVRLAGPDGSLVPAVPRYECEELVSCSATEGAGYDYSAIASFADKCADQGIEAPAGMCLQDLGWSSSPFIQGIDVEYVTWREYFERFGDRIKGEVLFSQEDICVALPWGNRVLGEMLRNVRKAENRILQTEKLLAVAATERKGSKERLKESREMLRAAWMMLMQAQHHDGYICATCGEGTRQWGFRSNKLALDACALLDHISAAAQETITGEENPDLEKESEIWLRVVNTVGARRSDQAAVLLGLEPGVYSMRVYGEDGVEVPSQYQTVRQYADGRIGTAALRFTAQNDGIGYRCYKVVLSGENRIPEIGIARRGIRNIIEVKTDCLHLVFDLMKGGSLVRFLDIRTGRDYAAGVTGFGSLRGYSVKEGRFISTANTPVACEILENGPLNCKLRFQGTFSGISFYNTVIIESGNARIDFETKLYFPEKTEIGFPYEPKEEERYLGTKRSSCREDYKIGVQIPLGNEKIRVIKSAPFDIYESAMEDTRFDSWETIKHNIINGYLDFYQESSDTGLTVFCDAVNGYSLVNNQFSLTAAFGYHGNFWWGYQPAEGGFSVGYSLMPHAGGWEEGKVSYEDACLREPLLVQRLAGKPERMTRTLLCSEDRSVETVTITLREKDCLARLFHAGYDEKPLKLQGELSAFIAGCTDPDGNAADGPADRIGKLEIKTLRCEQEDCVED